MVIHFHQNTLTSTFAFANVKLDVEEKFPHGEQ